MNHPSIVTVYDVGGLEVFGGRIYRCYRIVESGWS
jgi:hypothetical protein